MREWPLGFVDKMLWFIESNFRKTIELEDIADACGVSRFHMCRGFVAATGYSVMDYVRGRRLTEAARLLAAGAPSILDVALEVGYGSHEAFTRAFRERFGVTPEGLRDGQHIMSSLLVEPIRMNTAAQTRVSLEPPRREKLGPLTLVGLGRVHRYDNNSGIPSQWTDFQAYEGTLGETENIWFGVCTDFNEEDSSFRYMCAVIAPDTGGLPDELDVLKLPEQTYLVFTHREHVSQIQATMKAIWSDYIPNSDVTVNGLEAVLERYDERFDPVTGRGGFDILIPIKA